ncbi:tRNA lysidine(34) synthetase TilS [Caulobacter sp. UNC279MFTsu5.1]|uniref:tRNA lysidine(34) synthetase TilS n=1 Tax=Caulobacter sp. UNC279MFTsu5.1 TaxID=1502775 RepID=UPI0008E58415|nr:tRNA lysidine(34) synthetase TilS [Caulobacter sp. UNC279MFTsu5.1]SFJ18799.1 tRNA(Ile)-lysidine synthase [Caulobacter sp. UNC279MFTsu5.1]
MITTFPAVAAALDRRLRPAAAAPLAVGFSGGGDSLALLILTLDWARAHGRAVVALTVDHQLNPASAAWTAQAVAKARALGAQARALAWTGPKPGSGLSAAARAARHALLADAAREAGARVLLLGHTADDLAEAALMRAGGSTVPDPRDWSPSPAWPQGRGLFVLRPLLAARRGALRDWLAARGETWLDDPANDDPKSARARARARLSSPGKRSGTGEEAAKPTEGASSRVPPAPDAPSVTSPAGAVPPPPFHGGGEGYLVLPRTAPAAHVAAACLCAAGTSQPPRGERLRRLVDRIRAGETFTATLAGARIEAAGEGVSFFREPGETRRKDPRPLGEGSPQATEGDAASAGGTPSGPSGHLPQGGGICELPLNQPLVWDGRYELLATAPGLVVRPLQGLAARLPPAQRQALKGLPAAARPSLPVVVDPEGGVGCPILAEAKTTQARCLVADRFDAATGRVDQEPAT